MIFIKTILINVETIFSDYVMFAQSFWQEKATSINESLPEDFLESFLSAGDEAMDKTFFRFSRLQPFYTESFTLYHFVNEQLIQDNEAINTIKRLQANHGIQVGLIYDQTHKQVEHVSKVLDQQLNPIIQLYKEDAFIGKPQNNIFLKARALKKLKANDTWVLDATKHGILAAFLADMKGIYIDKGLGLSERVFKYSYRNLHDLHELEALLLSESNERA